MNELFICISSKEFLIYENPHISENYDKRKLNTKLKDCNLIVLFKFDTCDRYNQISGFMNCGGVPGNA